MFNQGAKELEEQFLEQEVERITDLKVKKEYKSSL